MGLLADANEGRVLHATVGGQVYARQPVRTHLITADDDITDVVRRYALPLPEGTALLALSERSVAITQGRAYPIDQVKVGRLAQLLWRRVARTPYGIGLASPQTMQLAIGEVGVLRILLGAAVAAVTRPFGIHGLFYRIAGRQAAAIDGPTSYTIPPYDSHATLAPRDPDGVARQISEAIGAPVAIIDANDFGCATLGVSAGVDRRWVDRLFADNPLGQSSEQTPMCVVRRVDWPAGHELPPEPRRRITPP
jgi:hypothetical protein